MSGRNDSSDNITNIDPLDDDADLADVKAMLRYRVLDEIRRMNNRLATVEVAVTQIKESTQDLPNIKALTTAVNALVQQHVTELALVRRGMVAVDDHEKRIATCERRLDRLWERVLVYASVAVVVVGLGTGLIVKLV